MENKFMMSWTPYPEYKKFMPKESWSSMPENGFKATFHNRDPSNPLMVGLDGEYVSF
jgi:hypothetical protein